jgi:hypothetical protein
MIDKFAYNEELRTFDFSPQLATGETLSSGTLTVTDVTAGTDVTATMVSGSVTVSGTTVAYKLVGGTAGKYYSRTFKVVTSAGQKLEAIADILMVI